MSDVKKEEDEKKKQYIDSESKQTSILGFVPALVIEHLLNLSRTGRTMNLPEKQSFQSVVMFADISGFTNLTETLSKIGPEGAEIIVFAINRYMELLVKGIGRSGGDIFKFAGDAMIVIWPPPQPEPGVTLEKLQIKLCQKAVQSALDLQKTLNDTNILQNIKLSVKIGFGFGDINIIHVGGVFGRTEYIATGDPLTQAFHSEHCASSGGQTIISKQMFDMIGDFFKTNQIQGKNHFFVSLHQQYSKVQMKAGALMIKNNLTTSEFSNIRKGINAYIPQALLPYIYIDQERWSSELRRLSVMFVNLGIDLSDANTPQGLTQIQLVIQTVQKCIYMHEGSLNKLLMDDKGSTLIVVFGLPPMSHQDDATRAILAAFSLVTQLSKIDCECFVGISTGTAFAGVVGTSGSRREYSVIGDSVNLGARLMQLACTDKDHGIILCEETAQAAEHKIACHYYKSVQLKGKQNLIPIYVPANQDYQYLKTKNRVIDNNFQTFYQYNWFPELRTHRNNFPIFLDEKYEKDPTTQELSQIYNEYIIKDPSLFMVGREDQFKKIQSLVDKFIRGTDKKGFLSIRGTFGAGKSLLLRKILYRVQYKIISNQYPKWKYNEQSQIFLQSLGPLQRGLKMCGVRNILKEFFFRMALRANTTPDEKFCRQLIQVTEDNIDCFDLLKESLGLKQVDQIDNFPPNPNKQDTFTEAKEFQFKKMILQFFYNYFEEILDDDQKESSKKNKKREESACKKKYNLQVRLQPAADQSNNSYIIAPVLLCFDDMQYYDELSFKVIKLIAKNFHQVMCIGLIRDQYNEIPNNANASRFSKGVKKSQDEIFIEGIVTIESVYGKEYVHPIILRGLQRIEKEDDFFRLIRMVFNINIIKPENPMNDDLDAINRGRGVTSVNPYDITAQEKKKYELSNYFLFQENKSKLMAKDVPLLFTHYVYLKSELAGNPSIAINLISQFIRLKQIKIISGIALITDQLLQMIDLEELIQIDAPICRQMVNGPMIDRSLHDVNDQAQREFDSGCQEQLILKVASVLGDIFDVQTLIKIWPFRSAIDNEALLRKLQNLESKEILEVMDVSEYNKHYRFNHLFFRECLYQRMTFQQRRSLHQSSAEAIQTMPQIYEIDELKEVQKLQFHWKLSTANWSFQNDSEQSQPTQPASPRKLRPVIKKQQNTMNTEESSTFNHKTLRSVILKQIQSKFAKSNNDQNTILKAGLLEKKSDKNITWAERWCVIDGREFRYYYTEQQAQQRKEPLSSVLLKNIYSILPLNEKEKDNKDWAFQLSVSAWQKKNKEMNERKFFFAALDDESLESWTIYFEFARAKAIYDEFVNCYGKIQFPLNSQLDAYDQSVKFDVTMKKKKPLNILQLNEAKSKTVTKSIMYRQSRISTINSLLSSKNSKPAGPSYDESLPFNQELLKYRLHEFLKKATLLFYAHLFEMAIVKEDEYRAFGQKNMALTTMTNLFQIDKTLLTQSMVKASVVSSSSSLGSRASIMSPDFGFKNDQGGKLSGQIDSLPIMLNSEKQLDSQNTGSFSHKLSIPNNNALEQIKEMDDDESFNSEESEDEKEKQNDKIDLQKDITSKIVITTPAKEITKQKSPFPVANLKSFGLLKKQITFSEVDEKEESIKKRRSDENSDQDNYEEEKDEFQIDFQQEESFKLQTFDSGQIIPKTTNQSLIEESIIKNKQQSSFGIQQQQLKEAKFTESQISPQPYIEQGYNKQNLPMNQAHQLSGDDDMAISVNYATLLSEKLNLIPQTMLQRTEPDEIIHLSQKPLKNMFQQSTRKSEVRTERQISPINYLIPRKNDFRAVETPSYENFKYQQPSQQFNEDTKITQLQNTNRNQQNYFQEKVNSSSKLSEQEIPSNKYIEIQMKPNQQYLNEPKVRNSNLSIRSSDYQQPQILETPSKINQTSQQQNQTFPIIQDNDDKLKLNISLVLSKLDNYTQTVEKKESVEEFTQEKVTTKQQSSKLQISQLQYPFNEVIVQQQQVDKKNQQKILSEEEKEIVHKYVESQHSSKKSSNYQESQLSNNDQSRKNEVQQQLYIQQQPLPTNQLMPQQVLTYQAQPIPLIMQPNQSYFQPQYIQSQFVQPTQQKLIVIQQFRSLYVPMVQTSKIMKNFEDENIPKQQIQLQNSKKKKPKSYFGIVQKNCHSIRGDSFYLNKGDKGQHNQFNVQQGNMLEFSTLIQLKQQKVRKFDNFLNVQDKKKNVVEQPVNESQVSERYNQLLSSQLNYSHINTMRSMTPIDSNRSQIQKSTKKTKSPIKVTKSTTPMKKK